MSLYNSLFGVNSEMPVLLGMLGVNTQYFDRFRDVELIKNGSVIRVFTRTGGGNREDYIENWEQIRKHEMYITDYDDDFDETYAYIEFQVPKKYQETAKKMFKGEPMTFENKFKKGIEEMEKPGTDAYKRAEKIADKILDSIDRGENKIIEI